MLESSYGCTFCVQRATVIIFKPLTIFFLFHSSLKSLKSAAHMPRQINNFLLTFSGSYKDLLVKCPLNRITIFFNFTNP